MDGWISELISCLVCGAFWDSCSSCMESKPCSSGARLAVGYRNSVTYSFIQLFIHPSNFWPVPPTRRYLLLVPSPSVSITTMVCLLLWHWTFSLLLLVVRAKDSLSQPCLFLASGWFETSPLCVRNERQMLSHGRKVGRKRHISLAKKLFCRQAMVTEGQPAGLKWHQGLWINVMASVLNMDGGWQTRWTEDKIPAPAYFLGQGHKSPLLRGSAGTGATFSLHLVSFCQLLRRLYEFPGISPSFGFHWTLYLSQIGIFFSFFALTWNVKYLLSKSTEVR